MYTSFIEEDIQLLEKHFAVDVTIASGLFAPFKAARGALRADVSLSWFASTYTFFLVLAGRMTRRPSAIILGGVDTVGDRELGYGVWRARWKRPLLRYAVRRAGALIAVDDSLGRQLETASGIAGLKIQEIPTGYDSARWTPGNALRERKVLCVAACDNLTRARVKGLDLLAEAGRRLPDVSFELVGVDAQTARSLDLPENLVAVPPIPRSALQQRYRDAWVYCQPSRYEGLPNALCEAMLCGCVPVVSSAGGMSHAVGDTGFVAERENVDQLVEALRRAVTTSDTAGDRARMRIVRLYSLDARRQRLVDALSELLDA
jgi:glycosyltransferase involved in cell wall biosynthesis